MTKEDIEKWLEYHKITKYVINKDLSVDINDSVYLEWLEEKELPFKIKTIMGSFVISSNIIETLHNFPDYVGDELHIQKSLSLKDISDLPVYIGGGLDLTGCYNIKLQKIQSKIHGALSFSLSNWNDFDFEIISDLTQNVYIHCDKGDFPKYFEVDDLFETEQLNNNTYTEQVLDNLDKLKIKKMSRGKIYKINKENILNFKCQIEKQKILIDMEKVNLSTIKKIKI